MRAGGFFLNLETNCQVLLLIVFDNLGICISPQIPDLDYAWFYFCPCFLSRSIQFSTASKLWQQIVHGVVLLCWNVIITVPFSWILSLIAAAKSHNCSYAEFQGSLEGIWKLLPMLTWIDMFLSTCCGIFFASPTCQWPKLSKVECRGVWSDDNSSVGFSMYFLMKMKTSIWPAVYVCMCVWGGILKQLKNKGKLDNNCYLFDVLKINVINLMELLFLAFLNFVTLHSVCTRQYNYCVSSWKYVGA